VSEWEAGESAAFAGLWFVNDKVTGKRVCEAASEKEAHEIVSLHKQIETWKEYYAELERRKARELACKDEEIGRLGQEVAKHMNGSFVKDATIAELLAEVAQLQQQAGNVLARIHRDGGHYIAEHGWEKACKDADDIVCNMLQHTDYNTALVAENTQLREDRLVLDGRVMVAETMLADFYHRAKDTDKCSRSPIDSPPPIVLVRHIIWQYETVMKTTDASGVLERSK
jgi:hypothetical protein